jgi:hypothetical protein
MRDDELLELWTRAGGAAGGVRCGALLAGVPEPDDVPVGELNRALLETWRSEFGDRIDCVAACSACGERLEFELSASGILAAGGPGDLPALEHGGRRLTLRIPTPRDLDAVAGAASPALAKRELARRCAGVGDESDAELDALADAVSAALEAADPHIAVSVALSCPACEAGFRATVDVGAHLWAAVDNRARRVIAEVADLATAYGWTEDEVLRLPPARRRAYAERAGR